MKRRIFLKETSLAAVTVCMGCLAACSKSDSANPAPSGNFSIDLRTNLLAVHDVVVQNNIRVVRIATGNTIASFTAVDQYCTHAAGNLNWQPAQNIFSCPVHGSQFNADGSLIVGSGPASRSLRKYAITVNNNTLTVQV